MKRKPPIQEAFVFLSERNAIMEFLSDKITEIKNEIKKTDFSPRQTILISKLTDLTERALQQQDLLTAQLSETEEKYEELAQQLRDLQILFLQNFDVDECGMPQTQTSDIHAGCECNHDHQHGETCDCGECDPDRPDDFYTLQCPFCEELFFIEKDELDLEIECPFCSKPVKASENIVKA